MHETAGGRHPLIDPLPLDAFPGELAKLVRPRVERLGYLGELIAVTARQPSIALRTVALSESLRAELPAELVEVIALAVAAAMGNRYEQFQHEQLCQRLGFTPTWITDALASPDSPSSELDDGQVAVRDLAGGAIAAWGVGVEDRVVRVVELLGQDRAVAVLQLVGYFASGGLVANALALEPPVPPVVERPVA